MNFLGFVAGRSDSRSLLQRYRQRLYRLAYAWTRDVATAEDLVQEALAKAWHKRAQLRNPNAGEAWLFSILARCHQDYLRRAHATDDIDELTLTSSSDPESENEQHTIVGRVRAAIASLPAGQRQAVTLVDLEGFSYAEVADILAVPVGTVMSRLCRARATLKRRLLDVSEGRTEAVHTGIRRIK